MKPNSQLIAHSRNFGSFAAIRTGLSHALGDYIGVMAADLQEPPELLSQMFVLLRRDQADVVFGQRIGRDDPALQRLSSALFWRLYRTFVLSDMPTGGVNICLRQNRCEMRFCRWRRPAVQSSFSCSGSVTGAPSCHIRGASGNMGRQGGAFASGWITCSTAYSPLRTFPYTFCFGSVPWVSL